MECNAPHADLSSQLVPFHERFTRKNPHSSQPLAICAMVAAISAPSSLEKSITGTTMAAEEYD
jgi:hypothetical protein